MENRGRKSSAELSVISGDGIVSIRRPEPPADLTEDQASEWHEVVNRLPADWFPRETHGMLAQYCRHVINARRVAAMIERIVSDEAVDVDTYDKLLKMQEREGRAMSSLATRMRLSQQTTSSKDKRKPVITMPKPWENK